MKIIISSCYVRLNNNWKEIKNPSDIDPNIHFNKKDSISEKQHKVKIIKLLK